VHKTTSYPVKSSLRLLIIVIRLLLVQAEESDDRGQDDTKEQGLVSPSQGIGASHRDVTRRLRLVFVELYNEIAHASAHRPAIINGEEGAANNSEDDRCLELDMNTFGGNLKLAALDDLDGVDRLVSARSLKVLDLVDYVIALEDLAEDNVTAVKPTAMFC
jgi:hypothetical protein